MFNHMATRLRAGRRPCLYDLLRLRMDVVSLHEPMLCTPVLHDRDTDLLRVSSPLSKSLKLQFHTGAMPACGGLEPGQVRWSSGCGLTP